MKLWLLRPAANLSPDVDPWEPWYDKAFGFVVRAETEEDARAQAQADAGDEKLNRHNYAEDQTPWLQPAYSTYVELTADGEAAVVIKDFASA